MQSVMDAMGDVREAMTVKRVFGEPLEQDGVMVVPVGHVRGAMGGGMGEGPVEEAGEHAQGTGGGAWLNAKPVGVFEIREGRARWLPAVDVNRVILGGQIVGVVALLVLGGIVRERTRACST